MNSRDTNTRLLRLCFKIRHLLSCCFSFKLCRMLNWRCPGYGLTCNARQREMPSCRQFDEHHPSHQQLSTRLKPSKHLAYRVPAQPSLLSSFMPLFFAPRPHTSTWCTRLGRAVQVLCSAWGPHPAAHTLCHWGGLRLGSLGGQAPTHSSGCVSRSS